MKILTMRELNVDSKGLSVIESMSAANPVSLFLDETDKYVNGFISWHWHPQLEFVLALTPIEIHLEERVISLAPHEALFINTGQLHMIRSPDGQSGATAYILLFSPEYIAAENSLVYEKYVRPIHEHNMLPYAIFSPSEDWHNELITGLELITREYENDDAGCELALRNHICNMWLILVRNLYKLPLCPASSQKRQNQFRLKQMLSFIRQNYMNKITLDDIAHSALISKSECLRCFRSRFDMTPIQYLIRCRLELACHLLRSGNMNIKEISARCGFEDASYFGRIFRLHFGITPLSYRRGTEPKIIANPL